MQVIKDGDEYSTDLQKCIQHVEEMESGTQDQDSWIPIVIYGGLSGRLDQTTAVLSLLHKLRQRSTSTPFHSKHGHSNSSTSVDPHDRSIPGSVKLPTGEELYISYDADDAESGRRRARGVGRRDIRVINDDCIAWALDSVSPFALDLILANLRSGHTRDRHRSLAIRSNVRCPSTWRTGKQSLYQGSEMGFR